MSQRVLVTGATGLIGSHLIDYFLEKEGVALWGFRRWRTEPYREGEVRYVEGDITDYLCVADAIDRARPHVIFHLAAQSYTGPSFTAAKATWDVNVMGTIHLLEAVRRARSKPEVIVVAGSAAAYGDQDSFPTAEDAPFRPVSPYGCSKAAQDLVAYQYWRTYGLPVIRTRSYIHVGVRQGLHNAVQSFAQQLAQAELGLRPPVVYVGNLEARRDILDVRDAVRAFALLAEKGRPGEAYNICRGEAVRIGDLLATLLRMSPKAVDVQRDRSRLRPTDPPLELGSCSKLVETTGWKPMIPIERTLEWILAWQRERARSENRGDDEPAGLDFSEGTR